eukprot:g2799.t1
MAPPGKKTLSDIIRTKTNRLARFVFVCLCQSLFQKSPPAVARRISKSAYKALVRDLREGCMLRRDRGTKTPKTEDLTSNKVYSPVSPTSAVLNALFDYHGSDRGGVHHRYGAVYDQVLLRGGGGGEIKNPNANQDRCLVRRVLEIGIGSVTELTPGSMAEYKSEKNKHNVETKLVESFI